MGRKVKAWLELEAFFIPMPCNLDWESIKEIRILPRNGCFYAEFIYGVEPKPVAVDPSKALGIDHGVGNWLTFVDTQGNSFIIEGRQLKSMNQWDNKRVATLKENQPQEHGKNNSLASPRGAIVRDAVPSCSVGG